MVFNVRRMNPDPRPDWAVVQDANAFAIKAIEASQRVVRLSAGDDDTPTLEAHKEVELFQGYVLGGLNELQNRGRESDNAELQMAQMAMEVVIRARGEATASLNRQTRRVKRARKAAEREAWKARKAEREAVANG